MTTNLVLALFIWLLTCACSVLAVALAFLARSGRLRCSMLFASAAILVSIMGLAAWTPFGFFPEFGYSWSNGSFAITVRSGWLFLVPLALAVVASVLGVWKHRRQRYEA